MFRACLLFSPFSCFFSCGSHELSITCVLFLAIPQMCKPLICRKRCYNEMIDNFFTFRISPIAQLIQSARLKPISDINDLIALSSLTSFFFMSRASNLTPIYRVYGGRTAARAIDWRGALILLCSRSYTGTCNVCACHDIANRCSERIIYAFE